MKQVQEHSMAVKNASLVGTVIKRNRPTLAHANHVLLVFGRLLQKLRVALHVRKASTTLKKHKRPILAKTVLAESTTMLLGKMH
jgi:hypothetical protein